MELNVVQREQLKMAGDSNTYQSVNIFLGSVKKIFFLVVVPSEEEKP